MANDFSEWVRGIPPVTRFLFFGLLGTNLSVALFGRTFVMGTILTWEGVRDFQIWRLLTGGFFAGGPSFQLLMVAAMLYQYSQRLETTTFGGKRADYVTAVSFIWTVLVVVSLLLGHVTFAFSVILALVYVWSQCNRDQVVSFYFGAQFKAAYLPWAFALFSLLVGDSPMPSLIGIGAGHLYYFLKFIYPQQGGVDYIQTPSFISSYFAEPTFSTRPIFGTPGNQQQQGQQGQQQAPPPAGGHTWGRGQRLGD